MDLIHAHLEDIQGDLESQSYVEMTIVSLLCIEYYEVK